MKTVVGPYDVLASRFRVLLTDIDVNLHMNNGRYLSIADVARFDLLRAAGLWKVIRRRGWYPVVVSSTITFRKSLETWQRFNIESRFLGIAGRNVFLEQRFVVKGEIYAHLFVAARFLKASGGHVPLDDLTALLHDDQRPISVPNWVLDWAVAAGLPSTKDAAPSIWD